MSDVVWHDLECGDYRADLRLWEKLALETGGPILELGCGTGRVAVHLGRRGHTVVGLDLDPAMTAAANERADGLPVRAVIGDASCFELDTDIKLALAPMQLMQLLPDSQARLDCLRTIAAHLLPGGRIALAIVEEPPEAPPDRIAALPDVRDVDGWVYSSLPLSAEVENGEIVLRRRRQIVSPSGELSEEENVVRLQTLTAERLESEGIEAYLAPAARRVIPPTDLHVGATVVVLERWAP